jgi:hypothetical protein
MHAIMTRGISKRLDEILSVVKDVEGAFVYSPNRGVLFEFLTSVGENKIASGTRFNTAEDFVGKMTDVDKHPSSCK